MEKNIKHYLHLYLGCEVVTPDGIGWLASVSRDRRKMDGLLLSTRVTVDFKTIRLTENSVDGYDKKRNSGDYLINPEGYAPINSPDGMPPDFTIPGGIKPILRPLSDMTEEESVEIAKIHKYDVPDDDGVMEEIASIYGNGGGTLMLGAYLPVSHYLEGLLWLLKNHFDLFGLIESGLAIDKTKQLAK